MWSMSMVCAWVCVYCRYTRRGVKKDHMGGMGYLKRERVRGGRGGDREQLVWAIRGKKVAQCRRNRRETGEQVLYLRLPWEYSIKIRAGENDSVVRKEINRRESGRGEDESRGVAQGRRWPRRIRKTKINMCDLAGDRVRLWNSGWKPFNSSFMKFTWRRMLSQKTSEGRSTLGLWVLCLGWHIGRVKI